MANWFQHNAPSETLANAVSATPSAGSGTGVSPTVQPNTKTGSQVTTPTGGAGSQDYAKIITDLQAKFPPTAAGFQQLLQALNQQGIPAMAASHAGGSQASDDKIVLPNGTYYDIRNDNGWNAPGTALHWDPSVPVFDAAGRSQNYNSVLQAKGLPTFQFTPTADDYGGASGPGQGGANLGGYASGSFLQPFNFQSGTYNSPSPEAVENSPAFQFRLKEGMQAIQRSAASKGTLLTGGTLKDLASFGQGLASTEYENEDARQFRNFSANDQNAFRNYSGSRNFEQQQFGNLYNLAGLGQNAIGGQNSADQTNVNQQTGAGDANANINAGTGTSNAANYISAGNALADYLTKRRLPVPKGLTAYQTANPSLGGA